MNAHLRDEIAGLSGFLSPPNTNLGALAARKDVGSRSSARIPSKILSRWENPRCGTCHDKLMNSLARYRSGWSSKARAPTRTAHVNRSLSTCSRSGRAGSFHQSYELVGAQSDDSDGDHPLVSMRGRVDQQKLFLIFYEHLGSGLGLGLLHPSI